MHLDLREITVSGKNAFERNGISEGEFGGALAEALRRGGADEAEIREALLGTAVDAATSDGPEWTLKRV